jgi:hypothetical protein
VITKIRIASKLGCIDLRVPEVYIPGAHTGQPIREIVVACAVL